MPVNPPLRAALTPVDADAACATLTVAGVPVRLSPGAATTVSVNCRVTELTPVPVACTLRVYTPTGTLLPTDSVATALELPLIGGVVSVPVTPTGGLTSATLTSPVKPPLRVTVPATWVEPPCGTVAEVGEMENPIAPVGAVFEFPALHAPSTVRDDRAARSTWRG